MKTSSFCFWVLASLSSSSPSSLPTSNHHHFGRGMRRYNSHSSSSSSIISEIIRKRIPTNKNSSSNNNNIKQQQVSFAKYRSNHYCSISRKRKTAFPTTTTTAFIHYHSLSSSSSSYCSSGSSSSSRHGSSSLTPTSLSPQLLHYHYKDINCISITRLFSSSSSSSSKGILDNRETNNNNMATASTTTTITSDEKEDHEQYTDYERAVRKLYQINLFNPVKLGLQSIQQIHTLLDNCMDTKIPLVIHIAGTNGKGSVALKIAKTIEYAFEGGSNKNKKVGLFCSPHVSSFRERMQINSQLITENEVVELLPYLYDLCDQHKIPATFFEITTALAFLYYARNNVDVVVLETGLGGRLDATNVISKPVMSIITSIGLEHTRILGDTIEKIAFEKGGIIKEGRPVLVGPNVPHDVLQKVTNEKNAGPYLTCNDVLGLDSSDIANDYDEENSRIAKAAIKLLLQQEENDKEESNDIEERRKDTIQSLSSLITPEIIQKGTSVRPPCRFERFVINNDDNDDNKITVVLDVAHNPPAMEYLVRKLKETFNNDSSTKTKKFRIVVGMSRDKDLSLCTKHILEATTSPDHIHLVQASHPRAATLEDILESSPILKENGCHYDLNDRSITKQIQLAIQMIIKQNKEKKKITSSSTGSSDDDHDEEEENEEEILVVCGSVFIMSEAREALGFDEPRDSEYIAEMAGANLRHGQENFGNNDTTDTDTTSTTTTTSDNNK